MEGIFSEDIDGSHYKPAEIIDLTHIDDLPPPVNPETGQTIDLDDELPDAMVVTYPEPDSLD